MAQLIKSFMGLQILRRPQIGFVRQMCLSKDLIKATQTGGPDLLLQNLKNATSTRNVLEVVAKHNKIMNHKHIIQALRSLFTLQKHGSSDMSTKQILDNSQFEKLCQKLKGQAGVIELYETIEALKVVCYVGVPSNSTIIQILLQLIRHDVNHLSLQQVIFVDFLLGHFKKSPLVDALKLALPMVFEINLPIKMERNNISQMADCLFYASRNNLNDETIETIVNAMMQYDGEFDGKVAKSIIWSICDMRPSDFFEPLLNRAMNSLIVYLDEMTYVDIESTLTKLIHKCSKKYSFYFNEVFFDSCANYVIDNDLGFQLAIFLLRKFGRIDFVNNNLLDYMSQKAYENPEFILKASALDIYSIAISVSLSTYKPIYWDNLKKLIEKTGNLAEDSRREIIWIKFGMSLVLLDIFKVDVLSKCLNEQLLEQLFSKIFPSDITNYLAIYQSITMYKPELSCLLPSKYKPEIIVTKLKSRLHFPLETSLEEALGGQKYLKTCLFLKAGLVVDHAMCFSKDFSPVTFESTEHVNYIEDFEIANDNQLVILLALQSYHYTINNRIKLSTLLSIRVLESKGYKVVPVCVKTWEKLADFEKIPYLMEEIRQKFEDNDTISGTVL